MPIECSEFTLSFSNGRQVELPFKVNCSKLIDFKRYVVILMSATDHRNIWCFDQDGNKLWEIEPSLMEYPYHYLWVDEQERLCARDQQSDEFFVDFETGLIELYSGERVASYEKANAFIRKRRKELR